MVRYVAPLALLLATLLERIAYPYGPMVGEMDGLWLAASLLLLAALFVQHRWPAAAVGLATFGAFVHVAVIATPLRPIDFAVPITVYTLASRARSRWVPLAALGAVLLVTMAAVFIGLGQSTVEPVDEIVKADQTLNIVTDGDGLVAFAEMFPAMAALVAAFALGDAARTRRAHLLTLEQRAADMQRERVQREALVVATERGRLGREMHDVVAHGLSVIVMQAQGGAAMLRQSPDHAAEALEHIIVTGRGAMADMRSLLGLANSGPQLAPQPGMADLPALIDRIRDAGTPVALDIEGEPPTLPTAIDLSVYRVAQEALTNVIKHAGAGASARVRLAFTTAGLELEVTDDGDGDSNGDGGGGGSRPDPEAGHGLRGMAERVAALGGEMTSGPMDSGGFRVRVLLPVRSAQEES